MRPSEESSDPCGYGSGSEPSEDGSDQSEEGASLRRVFGPVWGGPDPCEEGSCSEPPEDGSDPSEEGSV